MFSERKPRLGSVLVFDVNETLLDVNALRPDFERIFKDRAVLKEWFASILLYSQTVTQTCEYVDFGKLSRAGLQMVADVHQIELTADDIEGVMKGISSLPRHPDVSEGLQTLKKEGFRLGNTSENRYCMLPPLHLATSSGLTLNTIGTLTTTQARRSTVLLLAALALSGYSDDVQTGLGADTASGTLTNNNNYRLIGLCLPPKQERLLPFVLCVRRMDSPQLISVRSSMK